MRRNPSRILPIAGSPNCSEALPRPTFFPSLWAAEVYSAATPFSVQEVGTGIAFNIYVPGGQPLTFQERRNPDSNLDTH